MQNNNELREKIEGVINGIDFMIKLNELSDTLYGIGDSRLILNTERGQWAWLDKGLEELITQERAEAVRGFVDLIEKCKIDRVGGLVNGLTPVTLSSDEFVLAHLVVQLRGVAEQYLKLSQEKHD